ncbi:MAG: hypothetical protein R3290_07755 [Acidimicrobiia bacterium]|nr:hypothetical protein [Acidimicrobiia bacterium]
MDIGEQKRVITVEPEPIELPADEPAVEPVEPAPDREQVPA